MTAAKGISVFSVAPMMELTDRHCRYFHRKLSRKSLLYTEMITAKAVLHGDTKNLLKYNPVEKPLALQVGGADPEELSEVTIIAEGLGFDEINLNVGCPSSRVKSGSFGAILMKDPILVSKCVEAMKIVAGKIKVSVKCRIGVDEQEPEISLPEFISTVANGGVDHFIIHARKAVLTGLSPKENRSIPPLNYSVVEAIRCRFPELKVSINGGINSLETALSFLNDGYHGVMLGRAAYYYPEMILSKVDTQIYGVEAPKSMMDIVCGLIPYIEEELDLGTSLHKITRHLMRAFLGYKGAQNYRRHLSENAWKKNSDSKVLLNALSMIENGDSIKRVATF